MGTTLFDEYRKLYEALDDAQKAICSEYCSFGANHNPNCTKAHNALRRAYNVIVDNGGWKEAQPAAQQPRTKICPLCNGDGSDPYDSSHDCPRCLGNKTVLDKRAQGCTCHRTYPSARADFKCMCGKESE